MKYLLNLSTVLGLILLFLSPLAAQEKEISEDFKQKTIEKLVFLMNEKYVFPEVAEKTGKHLEMQQKEGHFRSYSELETFAEALTESVQTINKDKHMRIRPNPPYKAPEDSPERMIEEKLSMNSRMRSMNAGLKKVEKLEGNVGYLDLRGFAGINQARDLIDPAMRLLENSDAIIIDLRKNGGGDPSTVQYLCSFFFGEKVHLNSLYWREGDRTHEFWTLDKVGGEKIPDVPLFILTSDRTFSAAEEFSYNMQTRKRATLVGQTTGGGANPGGMMPLNDKLSVFIPTGRAINPITKTNWEGVGVVPEVKVDQEQALEKAHELAKEAAKAFSLKNDELYRNALKNLFTSFEDFRPATDDKDLKRNIEKCQKIGLLNEEDINYLGYEYLMRRKQPKLAEQIFKSNTQLYPKSANAYDSYAESLAANGKWEASIKNYQKAVKLAEKNGDENLQMFRENLQKVKEQAEGK
ncbi:MAG: S41 family peptidase [Bacteroidota bacterium]